MLELVIFITLLLLPTNSNLFLHTNFISAMNNQDLLKITEEYGSPVYVYDSEKIISQCQRLTNAFKQVKKLKINYAVKALSNISILKLFDQLGAGLDTVSIQEVKLGLQAGVDPAKIIYTPNGVSLEEIEEVASFGVQINIDNLSILEQFGSKHPTVPVCIRINPHVMAGGNTNISVGHIDSKFGISIHQIPLLMRIVENTGMNINGIHMHTGSDILDIEVFLYASEILFDTARHFKDLEFIDFGSGFKVPYKEGDIETNIEEFGEKLTERFKTFCKNYFQNWNDAKNTIIFIKTYQIVKELYKKSSKNVLTKEEMKNLLKEAIKNKEIRETIVKHMNLFMNDQLIINNQIKKICNDYLVKKIKIDYK